MIWGYSEIKDLLIQHSNVKNGLLVDTNILVAATYELDEFHEAAMDFIDSCTDLQIPLFCNVNIRSEFLEIHRRIIFSEAILDFEKQCKKAFLPNDLVNDLNAFRTRYERRLVSKPNKSPLKLSDSEIKDFKIKMIQVKGLQKDLWTELCEDRIGTKITEIWQRTENSLGLNFLSLRKEDQEKHLHQKPEWSGVTDFMSKYGLSSSDAMILNMFSSSKFEAIASSDVDIALAIKSMNLQTKHALIPDERKDLL